MRREHGVRAGLDRQVQVRHDLRASRPWPRSSRRERSLGWLVANRIAAHARGRDAPQRLGERGVAVEVAAVGVDVLAEQRDLDHAVGRRGARTRRRCPRAGASAPGRARRARCSSSRSCRSPR